MRYVIVVALLAGCAPGPAGPPGPAGERGPAGPSGDVSALQAEIADLRAQLAEVKAQARVKVPHYVDAETGKDLGAVAPGGVWREDIGGVLAFMSKPAAYFAGSNCTGEAWIEATFSPHVSYIAPWGSIVTAVGPGRVYVTPSSKLDADGCTAMNGDGRWAVSVADRGIVETARDPSTVAVEMR